MLIVSSSGTKLQWWFIQVYGFKKMSEKTKFDILYSYVTKPEVLPQQVE